MSERVLTSDELTQAVTWSVFADLLRRHPGELELWMDYFPAGGRMLSAESRSRGAEWTSVSVRQPTVDTPTTIPMKCAASAQAESPRHSMEALVFPIHHSISCKDQEFVVSSDAREGPHSREVD